MRNDEKEENVKKEIQFSVAPFDEMHEKRVSQRLEFEKIILNQLFVFNWAGFIGSPSLVYAIFGKEYVLKYATNSMLFFVSGVIFAFVSSAFFQSSYGASAKSFDSWASHFTSEIIKKNYKFSPAEPDLVELVFLRARERADQYRNFEIRFFWTAVFCSFFSTVLLFLGCVGLFFQLFG